MAKCEERSTDVVDADLEDRLRSDHDLRSDETEPTPSCRIYQIESDDDIRLVLQEFTSKSGN